jgi:hypothetical protein
VTTSSFENKTRFSLVLNAYDVLVEDVQNQVFAGSLEALMDIQATSFTIDLPDANWYGSPQLMDTVPLLRTIDRYELKDDMYLQS